MDQETVPKLSIQGKSTDHIWGMVYVIDNVDMIGLRLDCGYSGTVYFTKAQAYNVIDTLNSLLSEM